MPTRTVRAHTKKGGKLKVKSYKQKYKSDRGPVKDKKKTSLRGQVRTDWLKNKKGYFTGRAGKDGETTSTKHVKKGKDYTGTVVDSMGRIHGRYKSRAGQERYKEEIKKAHPKK